MTFAAKVAALRSFMGVPDDAPLPAAIEMINLAKLLQRRGGCGGLTEHAIYMHICWLCLALGLGSAPKKNTEGLYGS